MPKNCGDVAILWCIFLIGGEEPGIKNQREIYEYLDDLRPQHVTN